MRPWLLLFALPLAWSSGCRFGFELLPENDAPTSLGGQGGALGSGGSGGEGGSPGTGGTDPQCEDWLDESQIRRRRLTFDNSASSEALTDFTALVVLTAQTFNYSRTAPFGADVRFFDGDTGVALPHHVDTWNEGSISTVWVQVPSIEANDTDHIWMYYGGEDATPSPSGASYDEDFRAVWHLSESSGPLTDSTDGGIEVDWLGTGTGTQDAAGRIGLAIEPMDGDGATSNGGELDGLTDHTITVWVRAADVMGSDVQQTIFSAEEHTSSPFPGPGLYFNRNSRQVGTWADSAYYFSSTPANQLLFDEWAFIALRADTSASGGFVEVKVNGGDWETIYSGDASTAAAVDGSTIQIGTWIGPLQADFEGRIDEIQVSAGLRSDDWVEAQYRSQANLSFVTVGDEDTCNP